MQESTQAKSDISNIDITFDAQRKVIDIHFQYSPPVAYEFNGVEIEVPGTSATFDLKEARKFLRDLEKVIQSSEDSEDTGSA